jgi:hypothetical protein
MEGGRRYNVEVMYGIVVWVVVQCGSCIVLIAYRGIP